ncbi:MAG: class I SAM-dependent methyltransferase [Bacteroidota bacterium]|jgi:2-polyprenyl-3-methyl-5-hydroxy-6-metoxy-1,4-benzoquinol methylase|nr:class I SAM-dependent methyltransferase [Bacteroidota bacterium]
MNETHADIDPTMEYVSCNLCGGDDTAYYYSRRGALTGKEFRLVRCRNCGLFYLNPRLTRDALLALYDEAYYRGEGFDREVNYVEEYDGAYSKTDLGYHLARLRRWLPAGARVLDVGCGTGVLLRELEAAGFDAEGIEPSGFASAFARDRGHRVRTGDFLELAVEDGAYDAVLAMEVLEHVHDPRAFIERVHRALRPGGLFYYTTGNFRGFVWQRRLLRRAVMDSYVTPEGHIVFFSTDVMRRYLREAGFSTVFIPKEEGRRRESLFLTARFRRVGLLGNGGLAAASAPVRGLYWLLVRLLDVFVRPPLPLARK